jgi:hypothetical protein
MPAGSSTYTITVPIYVDEVKEDSEDLTVSLTDQFGNDPNYVVGPANQARIRIRANGDDLVPIITVEASSARVSEGGSATFTFRSTVESNEDLDLKVALGGSAVSGADFVKRPIHRFDYRGVLAHREIIVGAPDRHFPGLVGSVIGAPEGGGKARGVALEIGENPITALGPQTSDRALEMRLIVDRC